MRWACVWQQGKLERCLPAGGLLARGNGERQVTMTFAPQAPTLAPPRRSVVH